MNDPLAQLRPLLPPPELGFWPLAWGYWLLAVLALILVGLAYWRWRRGLPRRQRLRELDALQRLPDPQQWPELSRWLRQMALIHAGRSWASVQGEAWLDWFKTGQAPLPDAFQQLLTAPYQAQPPAVSPECWQYCRQWLTHLASYPAPPAVVKTAAKEPIDG